MKKFLKTGIFVLLLSFFMFSCTNTPKETLPEEEQIEESDSTIILEDSLLESFSEMSQSLNMMAAVVSYKNNEIAYIESNLPITEDDQHYIKDLKKDIKYMVNYYNNTAKEYNELKKQYNFGIYNQYVPQSFSELKYK